MMKSILLFLIVGAQMFLTSDKFSNVGSCVNPFLFFFLSYQEKTTASLLLRAS